MSGLAYESMFNNRPNNFGIVASDYVPTPTNLRLSENINDYVNATGRYTDINGVVSGRTPSLAAIDAVDYTKAPAVFSEKGYNDWAIKEALNSSNSRIGNNKVDTGASFGNTPGVSDGVSYSSVINKWTPEQWQNFGAQGGTIDANNNLEFGSNNLKTGTDTSGGGFMDFLGSDGAKNAIGIGGLALSAFGALNNYKAGKLAKKQWEAENARANEIMAMNREKYQTYKADKARLNAEYSGSGLAASGGK